MKKILPIYKPFIISYKHHAFRLAMIGDDQNYITWILNNYLQLYTPYDFLKDMHWLDFFLPKIDESCECLDVEVVKKIDLKNGKVKVQFLKETIITKAMG